MPPPPSAAWAYFFDIDGTLIDIADSPGGVRFDAALGVLIERLYRAAGQAVALISGRTLADIDRLFPATRLPAAGQHGTELRSGSGTHAHAVVPDERLAQARTRLAHVAARHRALLVEDKGLSLALHYRGAPRLSAYAHRVMRALQADLGGDYCVMSGKRVVELKPAGRDKGAAIAEFMHDSPFRGRTPVFVGDDVTDEYGFTMVNRLGGRSVKVGPGPTAARWRLGDVRAVRSWLAHALPAAGAP